VIGVNRSNKLMNDATQLWKENGVTDEVKNLIHQAISLQSVENWFAEDEPDNEAVEDDDDEGDDPDELYRDAVFH
jgi:hypothetical protein